MADSFARTRCDCTVIHEETVNKVMALMPEEESLSNLAELFKVLGDNTRIKILWALSKSEMCVCDLAFMLQMTQSAISHQLRILKQSRLVRNRKEGKVVFYSLAHEQLKLIFDQGMIHVQDN